MELFQISVHFFTIYKGRATSYHLYDQANTSAFNSFGPDISHISQCAVSVY